MKIVYFLFISMLLFSCTQKQETSADESKKGIEKDTLPRVELKFEGKEQVFSIHEIPEFDTLYHQKFSSCGIDIDNIVYTLNSYPKIDHLWGGMKIDSSFQGLVINYKNEKSYSSSNNIEEYRKQKCEFRKLLPAYKDKPCNLQTKIINGYEAVFSNDTTHRYIHYISMEILMDSNVLNINGFWKKDNSELKNKIIKSIYSFK